MVTVSRTPRARDVAPTGPVPSPAPAPNTQTNSLVLRNLTLFDGEKLHPEPMTVVIKHGVITAVVPSARDESLVRNSAHVHDKAGQFGMPALQDGEFHFHSPHQFLPAWANTPAREDKPLYDAKGRVARPPMAKLYRTLVNRGLLKTIQPLDVPWGNAKGDVHNAPLPLNDMLTPMNFGVFTVHDMQSLPALTHLFTRARKFKLERKLDPARLAPEEAMLYQFAKNTPRFETSGNWFIAGDLQYYPEWGTEGFYNLKDGWTKADIGRAVERRKTAHNAAYIKVYYDDFRRKGADQPKDRPAIDKETLAVIVSESHKRDMPVFVHARTVSEAEEALSVGADCLIHTPGDAQVTKRLIALARPKGSRLRLHPERPAFVIPTLSALTGHVAAKDDEFTRTHVGQHWNWTADPSIVKDVDNYISPYDTLRLVANEEPEPKTTDYALLFRNVAALHAAGIPLIAGIDASGAEPLVPGLTIHYEMDLIRRALVEFGGVEAKRAALEALKTATLNPTHMFATAHSGKRAAGDVPYGLVRKGYSGDVLVLGDNPVSGSFKSTVRIRDMYRAGFALERTTFRAKPSAARKVVDRLMITPGARAALSS